SSDDSVSPALLNSFIKNSWTIEALFQNCSRHQRKFNHIHVSACWNKLGHLSKDSEQWYNQPSNQSALESLVQQTLRVVQGPEIQARQLANIVHGIVKSGALKVSRESLGDLMKALAGAFREHMGSCNAQELANAAWAFAKAGHVDAELFAALASSAQEKWYLDNFNAQEAANTTWAFATAGHSDAKLFKALGEVVEQRLSSFTPQGLANTVWAFAKANFLDARLLRMMGEMAQQSMDLFNEMDLANTTWAFARLGQFDPDLFTALAKSAEWHLEQQSFNAQGLASTIWAFSKAGYREAALFEAFTKAVCQRLATKHGSDFNSQDLANIAWAFAKACQLDEKLFKALSRAAVGCLDDFNAQDLGNIAWAFAKAGYFDKELFNSVASSFCNGKQNLDDLTAPHVANIAWAFAKADVKLDVPLFSALARSASQRVGDFTTQETAILAWVFASANQLDSGLFASLASSVLSCLDDFDEEELDNMEWAFARAGQRKVVKTLQNRKKTTSSSGALASLGSFEKPSCGQIVVAGGGIGGAAVAVALQSRGFEVVVLEADGSFDARKQGYGLTIQGYGSTTQALGIDLASDDAPSTSHYTFSHSGEILGFFGEAFGSSKDRKESEGISSGRFIHIPRQMLRRRILDKLHPGTIRWNSKLKSFKCTQKSKKSQKNGVRITLTDGTNMDAALLVGSDGIFSTVRRQLALPGDRLNYVGLVVVLGIIREEEMCVSLAHRRIFETVDGCTRIYAMPFTTASTMWQLSFPMAEEAAKKLCKDQAALKAEIVRRCESWHSPIPEMLRKTPLDSFSGYPVYDRDLLEPQVLRSTEESLRRVTLIGDAAHPMTPFKAQGANQALIDAVLLADVLVESIQKSGELGFEAALPLFERKMLSRSARVVVGSREKAREMHSRLALQPARKVQRETGLDPQKAIRVLREKGIGAQCAMDPRGLDAVVAETIAEPGSSEAPQRRPPKRPRGAENVGARKLRKKPREEAEALEKGAMSEPAPKQPLWGYIEDAWHKCLLLETRKSGRHKVEWLEDGTQSLLNADCVQPRAADQSDLAHANKEGALVLLGLMADHLVDLDPTQLPEGGEGKKQRKKGRSRPSQTVSIEELLARFVLPALGSPAAFVRLRGLWVSAAFARQAPRLGRRGAAAGLCTEALKLLHDQADSFWVLLGVWVSEW
ncbi:auaG, partial [Symbiodinium necroappetens]